MSELIGTLLKIVALLSIIFVPIAAWLTHIIVCIQNEVYLLLIAGAIVVPVGVIHGIGIWFGAW